MTTQRHHIKLREKNEQMRLVRFTSGNRLGHGILEGDDIIEIDGDFFSGLVPTGRKLPFAEVELEVPIVPATFYAAGYNYDSHAFTTGDNPTRQVKPDIGYRAVNALLAHNQAIIIPSDAEELQYEGELVAVIGRKARNVSEDEALSYVLGYTIGNDISERGWQRTDQTFWRAKNTDTFKPMGPWIETALSLESLETTVTLNGTVTAQFRTNEMIFGVAKYISVMSRYLTLWPGDVIWMGTNGVSPNLRSGDIVEISISGIGTLRNTLVAEK